MCLLKLIFWVFLKYHLTNPTPLFSFVPDSSSKPKVECSVVTEFTDHICVTMDAELIMFLHDLVSAYLKEKEKGLFFSTLLIDVSLSVKQQCLFISTAHKFMTQLVTKKNTLQSSKHCTVCQEYESSSHRRRRPQVKHICLSPYLWSCPRVVGQIFGSSVTRSRLTVTFTHSRQVREPDARSILMGFKSSQRNKLALFMPATSLSSPQLKQPRLCSVDSAAK